MALPQSAIEQLSHRPKAGSPGWFGQLFMFSATLFFIAAVIFLGMKYGYQTYVNNKVTQLKADIEKYAQNIPLEDQQRTINFYAQLVNLKALLASHVVVSPLFNWLEDNTVANVYYTKFILSVPNRQLSLGGIARSLDDVTGQFNVFQSRGQIDHYVFTNARLDSVKNTWEFDATLYFTPDFFTQIVDQAPVVPPPALAPAPTSTTTSTPPRPTSTQH